jgi:uncharacterized SAM-binding protein YcdF (DUF218 family)
VRKERWGPSLRGCALALLLAAAAAWLLVLGIFPFLAANRPVESKTLVVEGWIHDYALRAAIEDFRKGGYEWMLTTGGPEEGSGEYTNEHNTSAGVAASRLRTFGMDAGKVVMVPSHIIDRDRTYSSAVALGQWLRTHAPGTTAVNVLTSDVHARRSRLLFQTALGPKIRVGIIAVPNPDYDPNHWWRYSEGVREVVSESVAYLYARLVFVPTLKK